jgi:hypothetical protein
MIFSNFSYTNYDFPNYSKEAIYSELSNEAQKYKPQQVSELPTRLDFMAQNRSPNENLQITKSETISNTPAYQQYKVSIFISEVKQNLYKWSQEDSLENSLIHIRNIVRLLEKNKQIFLAKNETRLLWGTISLLIRDGNWKQLSISQIRTASNELNRFAEGEINLSSIATLQKQYYRANIPLVKQDNENKEKSV